MKQEFAFPSDKDEGMTLRDYFAAQALQGFIADEHFQIKDIHLVAKAAYTVADAMMEARS